LLLSSACDFFINNGLPIESFVPQVTEAAQLVRPNWQDGSIKPFFINNTPEEAPVRPLEQSETLRGTSVKNEVVKTEEELIKAAQKCRRPVFYQNSDLRLLYNKVITVLNAIILNDMTDYQRVRAIYDYISYYTLYDFDLYEQYIQDPTSVSVTNPSFAIAGVFNNNMAVCEGFAEAFSLMCSIEGIENVIITGEAPSGDKNLPHAWNKVKLDGEWYAVDSTNASFSIKGEDHYTEYLNHAYFLVSDSDLGFIETGIKAANDTYSLENVKAYTNYGFYEKENIEGYTVDDENEPPQQIPKNYVFDSEASLKDYLVYFRTKHFLNNNYKAIEFFSILSDENIKAVCRQVFLITPLSVYRIRNNVYLIII
jgi:hypothetical protein